MKFYTEEEYLELLDEAHNPKVNEILDKKIQKLDELRTIARHKYGIESPEYQKANDDYWKVKDLRSNDWSKGPTYNEKFFRDMERANDHREATLTRNDNEITRKTGPLTRVGFKIEPDATELDKDALDAYKSATARGYTKAQAAAIADTAWDASRKDRIAAAKENPPKWVNDAMKAEEAARAAAKKAKDDARLAKQMAKGHKQDKPEVQHNSVELVNTAMTLIESGNIDAAQILLSQVLDEADEWGSEDWNISNRQAKKLNKEWGGKPKKKSSNNVPNNNSDPWGSEDWNISNRQAKKLDKEWQ